MNKFGWRILSLFVLIGVISACSTENQKLEYKTDSVKKVYGNDSSGTASIKFDFIRIKANKEFHKSINDTIGRFLSGGVELNSSDDYTKVADDFIDDYKAVKANFDEYSRSWYINKIVEVVYNSDRYFSISMSKDFYTGGAHPNYYRVLQSFDLENKKVLELGDLFKKNSMNEVNKIAEKYFIEARKLPDTISLNKAGFWFEDDKFLLNNNFMLTKSGIVFFYNNYEVAPYAMGFTEFKIPYKSVKEYLKIDESNL